MSNRRFEMYEYRQVMYRMRLGESDRGIENEPRDVAMYLIRSMRTEPLMRVGAGFGLNRYSSVSSAVMRIKIKLQKDRKFRDHLQYIENNILKGQTKT